MTASKLENRYEEAGKVLTGIEGVKTRGIKQ